MALKVKHDGSSDGEVRERCCLCRAITPFWHQPTDVALCESCAKAARLADLPTKEQWFATEQRLDPRARGGIYGW